MKTLLSDLDIIGRRRPFPNLALMKLSAYHKARGDEVWLNFPLCLPDIEYASCVFSWNRQRISRLSNSAIIGGSGVDTKAELAIEVEHIMPDYTLYPNVDFSLGFTSRGCIRKCPWCVVPAKEGGIQAWTTIYEFWDRRHKEIKLLDNNILASPNWNETAEILIKEQVRTDFNQGLDIRLVDDEVAHQLAKIRTKKLRFAFDHISIEPQVREGIGLLLKAGIKPRHLSFYVLIGFNGDPGIDRMKLLQTYGVDVYPMIYKGEDGKEPLMSKESLQEIRAVLGIDNLFWHGNPQNLRKFLRVIKRL